MPVAEKTSFHYAALRVLERFKRRFPAQQLTVVDIKMFWYGRGNPVVPTGTFWKGKGTQMKRLNPQLLFRALSVYCEFLPHTYEGMWERKRVEEQVRILSDSTADTKGGGSWLTLARNFIQTRAVNGSSVTWGSHQTLNFPSVSVSDVEALAVEIASSTIQEFKGVQQ